MVGNGLQSFHEQGRFDGGNAMKKGAADVSSNGCLQKGP